MAIAGQVQLVLPDLLRGQPIWGDHEVAHEVPDTAQVARTGVGAVAPDAELLVHPIADPMTSSSWMKGAGRRERMAGGRRGAEETADEGRRATRAATCP